MLATALCNNLTVREHRVVVDIKILIILFLDEIIFKGKINIPGSGEQK
jgi:hypothetical protein